ncbi:talin-1 isoform X1 [Ischnura elegans]|uniref:talin-1 isoform X1 n=1 Tax=Ischnura elegans TaxID=197161 RepID=UPI001ED8A676|nr:talin-1 isoform X1 [Ischnura elegans]XP_046398723.1 talin-1 isoform X1 [Ischnura elegans]
MAMLSLRISIVERDVTKTMQFDPSTSVFDACRIIREKISEANLGQPKDYGLFLADEDAKKGVWLEPGRNLEYYILRNGDLLEYRKKLRTLRVRMLDGMLKTLMVDDSQPVANLMVVICTKIGITNHDEYSLVREEEEKEENENKGHNFGTLTLKRRKEEKERDAKMEQLRKKLKTDDEVNWIDPSKTLREQGIDESETVLLRRKFFFSDQNIDSRDPVQLGLLYVQARDAIVDGTHPVTQEKACQFAGIQCQIQFGDYNENKHRPGFLDLKEFLPQSYVKVKGIEKKVFAEHKKHLGLSELDAKVLYTKTARSLKTYGVTFFLVKEKMKGKNKLVPRLLGVTKDSVLRLDERTKEILKTWPLTTVRRWGASPNTFTLDFGDYSDQYYSVQTTEAEQILQLISGYIDIILKKKKAKDHFGIEGDEGSTMVEVSVSPLKATILQHETASKVEKVNTESVAKPAVMRAGADGARTYGTGHMGMAQFTTISGQANVAHTPPMVQTTRITSVLTEPQRALLSTINAGQDAISAAEQELTTKAELPELGSDPASLKWKETTLDTNKQNVSSQIAAMNAATAQVVTLTSGPVEDVDHTAVGAAISTITTNLPEMTRGVRMIAALMEDDTSGDRLMDATRKLCSAFSDMLKATEPEAKEPRQNLLNAASRVGEASQQVLSTMGEDEIDGDDGEEGERRRMGDILLGLAKAVANATAALVLKAKNVAATRSGTDQAMQNKVIGAATQCALSTSQLVACAKVVAPTLNSPACQQQLMGAVREVARAVEGLVSVCQEACPGEEGEVTEQDEHVLQELSLAAAEVTRTLNDLLNHIKQGPRERHAISSKEISVTEGTVETIMVATDRLFASSGDAGEMVRQARVLGQATAQLIQGIKGEAEKQSDSEVQRRLLAAAKALADATARMVEAARLCASAPHDAERQDQLRMAAEELRIATTAAAATPAFRRQLISRLENAAKQTASTATQCIAAAHGVGPHNNSRASQEELMQDCRVVAERVPRLIECVKASLTQPNSASAQSSLVDVSQQFVDPGSRVVQSARAVLPTVNDQASAMQLSQSSKHFGSALTELQSAAGRAREALVAAGECPVGLDSAAELIRSLKLELEAFERASAQNNLRPLPGETAESAALQLGATSKNVGFAMAQMLSAAAQGNENYTSTAARDTATALSQLTGAVRAVAATSDDREVQAKVIASGEEVMDKSLALIEEARRALQNPEDVRNSQNLTIVAKEVSQSLSRCVGCLPGQKDVDEAINSIANASEVLNLGEFPHTNKPYSQLQQELNSAAAGLNDASSEVVASVRSPVKLASSSKQLGSAYEELLGVTMEMAGQTKDTEVRGQMVVSLKNVSVVSSKLLVTAKTVAANPSAPNAKNQLATAARSVTESINYLVDVCTSAAPGQKECDNAIRRIQSMRPLLDAPTEPLSEATYFECLDAVMEKSKSLGDGMTGIANRAKRSEHEAFGEAVRGVSDAICGLVEAAAQAAYLVGVSDPSSVAGRTGLVDGAQFARAAQAIQTACHSLSDPTSNQQQVLSAATTIAKHTSALCNACRQASSKTSNPVAKRAFVQSAKDVANSTASLVKEIKALDQDYSDRNRESCGNATRPLLEAVENLCAFAGSPEFAGVPARISSEAREAQEPITAAGRKVVDGSCAMIGAAKSLAVNPRDPPTWQQLAAHSKSVSDSIKKLVSSIRDKAPGQKECEEAIDALNRRIRELDNVSLTAVSQSLTPHRGNTLRGYGEQAQSAASGIAEGVLGPLGHAAKFEAEKIGHCVNQMVLYFEPLLSGAIGAASHMTHSKEQMLLLDQTKTVAECALQLVYAAKEGGGNPKAVNIHPDIDEFVEGTRDALSDLGQTLERLATQAGVVTGLIDSIERAMARVTISGSSTMTSSSITTSQMHSSESTADSFVDYQTRMVNSAKEIARVSQEMVTKSSSDVAKLGALAAELSKQYGRLATDSSGAVAACPSAEVSARLRLGVQELGSACVDLVRSGGARQIAPNDPYAQRDVADSARHVSEKVSQVLAALQAGSRGTQACINAASTVSGIIGDLDTTIMFATAGTLHSEGEMDTFSDHRESILKTAKALVEDTKTLVAGAASSQEQLAVAAQNAVSTIVQLAEVVKFGAASLGSNNPEAQVMLINAVKDVASALGDLIQATKAASGKSINDPTMNHLKDSAKVMVTNVTSLLKTVKAVEDEHTRGTRALESTVEAIAQEIRALNSGEQPRMRYSPEDLVRSTKPITLATAKAVSAGNSCRQEDIIVAANMGRKAISDMLTYCKGAAYAAETVELRDRTLAAGDSVATHYRELLQSVLVVINRGGTAEARQALPPISRQIAQSVTELVTVAELLKGTDWVDPDDPTVIAENELHGAAASIDAAAKKLASLRPRKSSSSSMKEADESMNFDEMILEAAKSIAAATSALVKAASAAQRELIDLGKVSRRPRSSSDDGQWSEGLVSAARLVAAATHSLVESANALVQGLSSEEKLISSAKQVASSTAQLLVACKVKADPDAPSTKRLQAAGNAVKRATDNLVRAAQQALQQEEERSLVLNRRMVGGIAQEINARSEVLRKERELEEARGRLTAIRQAKYRFKGSGPSDGGATSSDTENEAGYGSGYESFTRYETRSFDSSVQSSPGNLHTQQANSSFTNGVSAMSPSGATKANGPNSSGVQSERQFFSTERKLSSQSQTRKVSSSSFSSRAGGPPSPSSSPPPPPPPPSLANLMDQSSNMNAYTSSSIVSQDFGSHLPPPPQSLMATMYGDTSIEKMLHQSTQKIERSVTMMSSSSTKSFHMEKS